MVKELALKCLLGVKLKIGMLGAMKQKQASVLITAENILEFVQQLYHINDPVLCLWLTEEAPGNKDAQSNEDLLDLAVIFTKEDIESLFFPNGLKEDEWNLTLACLSSRNKPLIGWLSGIGGDTVVSVDNWLSNLEIDI